MNNPFTKRIGAALRRIPLLVNAWGVSPHFPFGSSPQIEWMYIGVFGAITGTSGSPQTISGPSTTRWFDGMTRVRLEWVINTVTVGGSSGVTFDVYMDSTIILTTYMSRGSSEQTWPVFLPIHVTPPAGMHNFTIKAWKSAGSGQEVDYGEVRIFIG